MKTMNSKISVSQALAKIEAGESVEKDSVDFDRVKVEALDVIKLAKAGIEVPEHVVFMMMKTQNLMRSLKAIGKELITIRSKKHNYKEKLS